MMLVFFVYLQISKRPMAVLDFNTMLKALNDDYIPLVVYHLNEDKPITLKGKQQGCRFCKRCPPSTTFNKVAHAIPHFIGNQHLKSEYECDDCNQLFSRYESQFSEFMKLWHVFSQVNRGGGKVPKYKNNSSEKSSVKYENGRYDIKCFEGEELTFDLNEEERKVTIKGKRSYIPQDVHKALSKMALTIMPEEDIDRFQDTLLWLRGSKSCGKGFTLVVRMYREKFPFISCMVFKRKDQDRSVPAYLFGIAYSNFFLQIAIPLCKDDKDKQGKELTMPYIPTPLDGKVECICCSRVDLSSTDKHKDESCSITFGYESLEEILSSDLPQ